jgi:hypothetical protein
MLFISVAEAGTLEKLITSINNTILNPTITVLFAIATVYFIFGVVKYFMAASGGSGGSGSDNAIQEAKRHMTWGIIGMVIMISVYGIMNIIIKTIN